MNFSTASSPNNVPFWPITANFQLVLAEDIGKIIQGLNHNKADGHDNISIRILKISGDTICKPLEMIYSQTLTSGSFPSEWKKGSIVPIHKKMIKKT